MKKGLRILGVIALCLLMLGICIPNLCLAQLQANSYNVDIKVQPSSPTEQDNIHIIVSGEWGNPGYDITSHTCSISKEVVTIEATIVQKPGVWAQVISKWKFTEDIGKLPFGSYVVEANVNDVTSTTEFSVLAAGELPLVIEYKKNRYIAVYTVLEKEKIPGLIKVGEVKGGKVGYYEVYRLEKTSSPEALYLKVGNSYPAYIRADILARETGWTEEKLIGDKPIYEVKPLNPTEEDEKSLVVYTPTEIDKIVLNPSAYEGKKVFIYGRFDRNAHYNDMTGIWIKSFSSDATIFIDSGYIVFGVVQGDPAWVKGIVRTDGVVYIKADKLDVTHLGPPVE